ncbi:hypothetical protein MLD38_022567 [Melastoma candidum]|uniref:Uncharacterized protein n=1 Tax=Melastoma candidum TaxID=119954 RepID=A0ACB9QK83_9MYRT|nr:hypothetical protein MLD38_022567 [Melastoma candidum]
MPSPRSDWDAEAFSSPSRPYISWIDSEDMASGDDLDILWSGVDVEVSVSEANGGSAGSGAFGEESEWGDEELAEAGFDFEESLEIGVDIVEDDGNEVDVATEGGGSDLNLDTVEGLALGGVRVEADWADEGVVFGSFGDFVEEGCDLEEDVEIDRGLGGSVRAERDHAAELIEFEEILGVDGNSVARSSDVVNNSNMDGDFDLADGFGISGDDDIEEGHTSEGSSDFDYDIQSESEVDLYLDSLRGDSHDIVIRGDYVVFEDLDIEGSVEQIFDQIMRTDIRRGTASSAAAKDVVEGLPVMEVREGMFKGSDGDGACAVCKNNVQVGERVKRLPCLHYFHEECIVPWLEIRNTCPLCRHELPTGDAGGEAIRRMTVDSGGGDGGSTPNQLL